MGKCNIDAAMLQTLTDIQIHLEHFPKTYQPHVQETMRYVHKTFELLDHNTKEMGFVHDLDEIPPIIERLNKQMGIGHIEIIDA